MIGGISNSGFVGKKSAGSGGDDNGRQSRWTYGSGEKERGCSACVAVG